MMTGHRILSEPVKIHFAGFEGTTYSLQQAGWRFSAEQDVMSHSMRLAMKHDDLQMYGISGVMPWEYRTPNFHEAQVIMMQCARRIDIRNYGRVEPRSFQAIDCHPILVPNFEIHSLEDFAHFAPALTRTKEIIVPESDVEKLMSRILELQDPARQAALRAKVLEDRRGKMVSEVPGSKFEAQIISIAA